MECMCHWRYWNFSKSWMIYGNGNFHVVSGIWGEKRFWLFEPFSKFFLSEPSLFEHSLKSELVKECTKEYEGKIMVQEQWLQLKMAGWANFWCLDYWKNGSIHFYLWLPGKIIPKVFITSKQREISHSPWTGFYRMFVHKRTSRNIFEFISWVYIKLLPRIEDFFVLMVLVSASVTISSKFLRVIPRMIS